MKFKTFKTNRLFISLFVIVLIAFLAGILFLSVLDKENQTLVTNSVNSYFNNINDGKINYLEGFVENLGSSILLNVIVWVVGISIIGVLFVYGFLIIKSFLLGFGFSSILFTYGFRGIVVGLIHIIPEVISLFILFIVSYYAISFSYILFNYLFKKKECNRSVIVSRYLRVLIISCCVLIINSLISVFLIPNVLRIF